MFLSLLNSPPVYEHLQKLSKKCRHKWIGSITWGWCHITYLKVVRCRWLFTNKLTITVPTKQIDTYCWTIRFILIAIVGEVSLFPCGNIWRLVTFNLAWRGGRARIIRSPPASDVPIDIFYYFTRNLISFFY